MGTESLLPAGAFGAPLRLGAAVLAASLLMAACGSETVRPEESDERSFEMQILQRVNGYRSCEGIGELRWNEIPTEIARVHAHRLASGYPLGHGCFEYRMLLPEVSWGKHSAGERGKAALQPASGQRIPQRLAAEYGPPACAEIRGEHERGGNSPFRRRSCLRRAAVLSADRRGTHRSRPRGPLSLPLRVSRPVRPLAMPISTVLGIFR